MELALCHQNSKNDILSYKVSGSHHCDPDTIINQLTNNNLIYV